ncbi:hypothetical protein H4R20_006053 [Coemansia guatemalensis]|uniref:Fork-head domain-containing protein n=1 Tax=Coemansia guatemalensis TaxID=2761395 RepID=A0A9W8LRI9_9FUNG|nr:hypothetical protein H4R20_006053 [Coemansia guatemalensis]
MSKSTDLLSTPKPTQHAFDNHFSTPTAHEQTVTPAHSQAAPDSSNSTIVPASATGDKTMNDTQAPVQAYAKLEGPEFCYYVRTLEVSLGRHQSSEHPDGVDIDLGDSKAVSRRHAKIYYNFMSQAFELQVFGKNGCLVDDEYYAKGQSVPLRHKTVVQIGDTEFTFMLPKAAMPTPASAHGMPDTYSSNGSMGHHQPKLMPMQPIDMAMPAQHYHPHPGHPHYVPQHLQRAQPPPPPQHQHPPPTNGGYPVNAITPQRLNLYPPADSRNPHSQPMYHQHSTSHAPHPRHSPTTGSAPSAVRRGDREPPAPLSFGEVRNEARLERPAASGAYSTDAPDSGRRSESLASQDSYPSRQQSRPLPPSTAATAAAAPAVQKPHDAGAKGDRGNAVYQQQVARRSNSTAVNGATGPSEVRILPSTERPAASASQKPPVYTKPTYSYASLIAQAINSTEDEKITLNGIYTYIMSNYPYYKHAQSGWQNSIRHNLSLNKAFVRMQRASNESGKGSYWAIDTAYKGQFANGVYKRTRRTKKAMEIERQQRVQQLSMRNNGSGHTTPIRSAAGEKRASPDDGYDIDDYTRESRSRSGRMPPKRLSVGAQSTGEDTVGYMSSAQSHTADSNPNSLPDSPQTHEAASRNGSEGRSEETSPMSGSVVSPQRQEPPANGTRSKTNSAKSGSESYATPASITLPSSSRPSQPRPQRSAAR